MLQIFLKIFYNNYSTSQGRQNANPMRRKTLKLHLTRKKSKSNRILYVRVVTSLIHNFFLIQYCIYGRNLGLSPRQNYWAIASQGDNMLIRV